METPASKYSVIAGVLAAIGASVCCVAPLLLLSLGVSGAWIGSLTAFQPFRGLFIAVTLVFFALAYRKLYRTPRACAPDAACADSRVLPRQRAIFWISAVLVLALVAFPWIAPALL